MTRSQHLQFFITRNNITLSSAFCLKSTIGSLNQIPNIVIYGGVHGTETAGVDAIIKFVQMVENKEVNLKNCNIIFILGNPAAYLADKRFIDENLNRCFVDQDIVFPEVFSVGSNMGTRVTTSQNYERNRAEEISQYLSSLQSLNYSLDFHSVSSGDLKVAICQGDTKQIDFMVNVCDLKTQFVYDKDSLIGTTMELGVNLGALCCAIECGNHKDKNAFKVGLQSIIKLLENIDCIDKNTDITNMHSEENIYDTTATIRYTSISKIVPEIGFCWSLPVVETGVFVPKGTIYARIGSEDDKNSFAQYDKKDTIKKNVNKVANRDMYLFIPDKNPNPNDSDAGFFCEREFV